MWVKGTVIHLIHTEFDESDRFVAAFLGDIDSSKQMDLRNLSVFSGKEPQNGQDPM